MTSDSETGLLDVTGIGNTLRRQDDAVIIVDIFFVGSDLLATDPRDRVYAFLGLAGAFGRLIKPDYSLSIQESYRNLSKLLVSQGFGRSLMPYAGLGHHVTEGLPSWCFDLSDSENAGKSLHVSTRLFGLYFEDRDALQTGFRCGPKEFELTVTGCKVDTIQALGPARFPVPTVYAEQQRIEWLRTTWTFFETLRDCAAVDRYRTRLERFQAFCQLMVAGDQRFSAMAFLLYLAHPKAQLFYPDFLSKTLIEMVIPKSPEREWASLVQKYWQIFEGVVSGRRACVTEKGYFGLVLESACARDGVCFAAAAVGPLVLREAVLEKEKRLLIGDAFFLELVDDTVLMEEPDHREIILQ